MSRAREIIRRSAAAGYHVCRETGIIVGKSGSPMKGAVAKNGYVYVTLTIEGLTRPGKGTAVTQHQMVAFAKYGEAAFEDGIEIRHLDGDRTNNRPSNLLLGTRKDNMLDMAPDARSARNLGKPSARRKLTDAQAEKVRDRYLGGISRGECKELADRFGVCASTISYIGNRRTYNVPSN
ncbi:HNH endonuclease [Rhodobacter phage RcIroh]|nr:HNH endonuclease [Rhodobacter phage RcIroh]